VSVGVALGGTAREFTIREARAGDGELLLEWVKKLAAFENLSASVTADARAIERDLFDRRLANALFVETGGTVAAFAVWYLAYSTFSGRPVLYLEDIFVDDAFRGRKIASEIFDWLETRARAEGCEAMRWSVLDWNGGAKAFYASRGAKPVVEWELYGMTL
jgi:GNAT superfamily N-acetyltransferase